MVRTTRLIVRAGSWAAEDAAQEALVDVARSIRTLDDLVGYEEVAEMLDYYADVPAARRRVFPRRRWRRVALVAVPALALALAAPALALRETRVAAFGITLFGGNAQPAAPGLATQTIVTNWRERQALSRGDLAHVVEKIVINGDRWRVYARITNRSPYRVAVTQHASIPSQVVGVPPEERWGMSMAYIKQLPNKGYGSTVEIVRNPAKTIQPELRLLRPGATWRRSFAGAGASGLPRRVFTYVGLGLFTPLSNADYPADSRNLRPRLLWTTEHGFKLR